MRGSDLLWLAVPLLLKRASSASSAVVTPALPAPARDQQARVRTGGDDVRLWFAERFGLALEELPKLGVPDVMLRPVALSIVAQWAHETGRGKSEFNFNLGGWRARKTDPFFTARDVLTPGQPTFRWTAYSDVKTAVADQLLRLKERFPSAWRLLLSQPNTSAWIEELGRRGYYTAPPSGYVRAWAANRAELERLAP